MKAFSILSMILAAGLMSACASASRSYKSGYLFHDEDLGSGPDRRALERDSVRQEMGIRSRDLDDREARAVDDRVALRRAEKTLEAKQEREQYFKYKPYIRTDRERIEFLQLDSLEARERWIHAKGISMNTNPPEIQALVDANDVTLGMSKQAVRDSWGEPELVEVSGNPIYGNERWRYDEQIASPEGYQTEHRLVYFEGGRVVGWEKH